MIAVWPFLAAMCSGVSSVCSRSNSGGTCVSWPVAGLKLILKPAYSCSHQTW
jgi:hypothetical protein